MLDNSVNSYWIAVCNTIHYQLVLLHVRRTNYSSRAMQKRTFTFLSFPYTSWPFLTLLLGYSRDFSEMISIATTSYKCNHVFDLCINACMYILRILRNLQFIIIITLIWNQWQFSLYKFTCDRCKLGIGQYENDFVRNLPIFTNTNFYRKIGRRMYTILIYQSAYRIEIY